MYDNCTNLDDASMMAGFVNNYAGVKILYDWRTHDICCLLFRE